MATPQKPYPLDVLVLALVHQEIMIGGLPAPLLQIEHHVNGMWNQIIGHYYPGAQGYIVSPEAMPKLTDARADEADLVVRSLNPVTGLNDTPIVLAYEGKGGHGQSHEQAVIQLCAFMEETSMQQGDYSYMVVAKGARVKFFIFRAGNWGAQGGNLVPLIMRPAGGRPTRTDGQGDRWRDASIFDLTDNGQKEMVYGILTYMVNHPNDHTFTH